MKIVKKNRGGLISIIVPVYNVERYLMRGLNSLKNQTYTNIEVILVDDGSTDSSGAICDRYAAEDERFHAIHQNNSGASVARNQGLEACHGDYIMFMDSDDCVDTNMCQELMHNLIEKNADISVGGVCWVYPEQVKKDRIDRDFRLLSGREAVIEYFLFEGGQGLLPSVCGKLFSRELFKNIRFPEDLRSSEDRAVIYKLFYKAKRIVILKKWLYFYIQRNDSLSHGNLTSMKEDFFCVIYNIIEYWKWSKYEALDVLPAVECGCIRIFNKVVWECIKCGVYEDLKEPIKSVGDMIVLNFANVFINPYATAKIKRRYLLMKLHLLIPMKQLRFRIKGFKVMD